MPHNLISQSEIEVRHAKTETAPDEYEYDGGNGKLNDDQQSYEEKSNTDDSNSVAKSRDQEIKKTRKIFHETENLMTVSSKQSEQI